MSEPRVSTGAKRTVTCDRCGGEAEEREHVGLYGSGPAWSTEAHLAPCGLWCFKGGTRGAGLAAYREGRMHGLVGYPGGTYPGMPDRPCPACTGRPPVSTAEARVRGEVPRG